MNSQNGIPNIFCSAENRSQLEKKKKKKNNSRVQMLLMEMLGLMTSQDLALLSNSMHHKVAVLHLKMSFPLLIFFFLPCYTTEKKKHNSRD